MAAKKRSVKKSGKTPIKTPNRPGGRGGALLSGNPGNKGGGRPPDEFKEWCRNLLDDPGSRAEVEAVLKDRGHSAFHQMWKAVADRAHGKPKEHVQVDMNDDFGAALREARERAKNR